MAYNSKAESGKVSLTKSEPTNSKGVPNKSATIKTQEQFFAVLESEMRKIDNFTKKMLAHITNTLSKIEKELHRNLSDLRKEELQAEVGRTKHVGIEH